MTQQVVVTRVAAGLQVEAPIGLGDLRLPGTRRSSLRVLSGSTLVRTWRVPATPACAEALDLAVPGASWDSDSRALVDLRRVSRERLEQLRAYNAAPPLPRLPWPHAAPWAHQLAATYAAPQVGGYLLYLGMGAGKTRVTLDVLRLRQVRRVLVLAPLSVVPVWARQAEHWHPGYWHVVELGRGPIAKRREAAIVGVRRPSPTLVVVNYEAAWRAPLAGWIEGERWDAVVADEVQKLKAPGGAASRWAEQLADRVPLRIGLSGTPTPQGPEDAYGVYRFLDKGIFGTSYRLYAARYLVVQALPGGGSKVTGYQREEEWRDRFYSIAYRVDRDVLDLPPESHQDRLCELPPTARRIYRELRDEALTYLETVEDPQAAVVARNALAAITKLQQLAGGTLVDDERRRHQVHDAKARLLAEVLDELGDEPVVVFARYTGDLDWIHHAAAWAGVSSLELSGRRRDLEAWQDGEGQVLAVQIQSGGVGIDLTRACYGIYYSATWSLHDTDQSLARIHRPGQTRPVTYIHLLAAATVDEKIRAAVAERRDLVARLLEQPREVLAEAP